MKSEIIKEIQQALEKIDERFIEELVCEIADASRIFLWGLGRSGMMAKAFAMRLSHLGKESYFVGELCPPLRKKDLLIIASKTGRPKMLIPPIEAAKKSKARTLYITGTKNPLIKVCDRSFVFNLPSSSQFGGSLFEQTLFVFFDEIVERYRKKFKISFEMMEKNHANWE